MPIYFNEIGSSNSIRNKRLLKSWIKEIAARHGKILKDVSIIFCSDEYLLSLNKKYLKRDFLTDVISFDYSSKDDLAGDIFISMDRVRENAEELGVDVGIEMRRIIIHGVLHIIGYSDKTKSQKNEMTRLENCALDLYKPSEKKT